MTADDQARLDALTPERLRADAAWAALRADQTRRMIADCARDGPVAGLERLGDHLSDLAILCEAVAGAETAYRTWRFAIGDGAVYFDGVISADHGKHPTLAAALGAVSETNDA